jgi:dihydrofolate reductase
MRELARYDAFVMGRVTYEKFYAHSQATLAQRPVRSRAVIATSTTSERERPCAN